MEIMPYYTADIRGMEILNASDKFEEFNNNIIASPKSCVHFMHNTLPCY